jgi:diguanylate cyclase (GGDEF)-like protein
MVDAASMLWQPVHQHGEVVAVLVVSWAARLTASAPWEVDAVALLGDELAIALDQETLMRRLRALAVVDPLTGVGNRRAWDEALDLELSRARRSRQALTVAMFDLDHFKHFNDTRGHAAGDELLVQFAAAAGDRIRDVDAFARWGGEEFALALPGCDAETAATIVERVRSAVPEGQTCSAGCAVWDGLETSSALLTRVDDALYVAKTRGRDRTVVDGRATVEPSGVAPTG